MYVKCQLAQFNGEPSKRLTGGLVAQLTSPTVKIGAADYAALHASPTTHTRDLSVGLQAHTLSLSPAQGCFETADFVRLEVHGTDLLSDRLLGYALVPMDDVDMYPDADRTYPLLNEPQGKGAVVPSCTVLIVRLRRTHSATAAVADAAMAPGFPPAREKGKVCVGQLKLRCVLRDSNEYQTCWPAEAILAGNLVASATAAPTGHSRGQGQEYPILHAERCAVAPGYEGLELREVLQADLVSRGVQGPFAPPEKPVSASADGVEAGKAASQLSITTTATVASSSDGTRAAKASSDASKSPKRRPTRVVKVSSQPFVLGLDGVPVAVDGQIEGAAIFQVTSDAGASTSSKARTSGKSSGKEKVTKHNHEGDMTHLSDDDDDDDDDDGDDNDDATGAGRGGAAVDARAARAASRAASTATVADATADAQPACCAGRARAALLPLGYTIPSHRGQRPGAAVAVAVAGGSCGAVAPRCVAGRSAGGRPAPPRQKLSSACSARRWPRAARAVRAAAS